MKKNLILGAIVALILVFVLSVASVYWFGSKNSLGLALAQGFNLPIAHVGTRTITFNEFFDEVEAVKVLFGDEIDEQTIYNQVWKKMVDESVLLNLASEYNLEPSQGEIDIYSSQLLPQDPESLELLTNIYGNKAAVERVIVVPFILEDKLTRALVSDGNSSEYKHIQEIAGRLAAGEEFEALQTEIFDTYNTERFTEQFTVTKKQLDQSELGGYILGLQEGDYSGVVASYDGYRIFNVVAKATDPEEAWELTEIFIPYNPLPEVLIEYKSKIEQSFYAPQFISSI